MSYEGIILIDKPTDFTSFDVIAKLRGMTKTKKVGHAGTLDPMATGVLPVFFGRAAKACDILPNQDKAYRAVVKLGITTTTQDITGEIISSCKEIASLERIKDILPSFTGKQMQLPPMYSAVRVDGVRLYDLARQGIDIKRQMREIEIYSIDYIDGLGDEFTIDVHCSKGSYIRTLCHDIGAKLGCGAALLNLRRTMAAGFDISECITLKEAQDLTNEGKLETRLLPIEYAFKNLKTLSIDSKDAKHYLNGVRMSASRFNLSVSDGDIAVYDEFNKFLGVSYVNEQGLLKIKKQFVIV